MAKKSASSTYRAKFVKLLPALKKGEIYRGIVVDAKGKPLHHVVEIPLKAQDAMHGDAGDIAEKAGAVLPSRREGRLIAASDDAKRTGSFWLADSPPGGPGCAYYQGFSDGSQHWNLKSSKLRVVAVRRVAI